MFYLKLAEPWFSLINLKIKVVEGRLNQMPLTEMKPGDYITFTNDDFNYRETTLKIVSMKEYPDFQTLLENETVKRCLPGFPSVHDGLSVYYKYFTNEQEKEHGVVALTFGD